MICFGPEVNVAVPAGPKYIMQQDYLLVDCLFLLTIRNRAVLGRRVLDTGEKSAHLQSSVSHYSKILHNLNMKNGRSDTPLS